MTLVFPQDAIARTRTEAEARTDIAISRSSNVVRLESEMDAHTQSIADRIKAAHRGKVNIHFVYPPIPLRQFDWCATFDNDEPNDDGQMLAGYGKTEAEALEGLLTTFEDLHQ